MSAPQAAPAAAPIATLSPIDKAKSDIENITDTDEQKAYFASLPADVREVLKPWLKERKEKKDAPTKEELDDLF